MNDNHPINFRSTEKVNYLIDVEGIPRSEAMV